MAIDFKPVFALLKEKKEQIVELEKKEYLTKGKINLDGEEINLKKANKAKLLYDVLPKLVSYENANVTLIDASIPEMKINGYKIADLKEDCLTAISKLALPNLKNLYNTLYTKVSNNKGVPEELKAEYEGMALLDELKDELESNDIAN